MNDYVISCCSTVDIPEALLQEEGIRYTYFHYEVDGVQHNDDFGKTMSPEQLFKVMNEGAITKTAQVSVGEYIELFESILKEGKDVLHATLSSGISGTYNSAMIAKSQLEDSYPDRKIYVVDSLCACGGQGLFVLKLNEMRKNGMGIDELHQWAEEHKYNVNHWVFTDDLTYLIRGGRVSKTAGVIGNALNICPIIEVNVEGKLVSRKKVRTMKKTLKEVLNIMLTTADDTTNYNDRVIINHAACYHNACILSDMIQENFPNLKDKVLINDIGATIGSHTGPGTIALFYWGAKRVDL